MEPIVSTFDIARAPEVVFRYATDPTRFAEWQHDVVEVRPEGPDPLGMGSRFATVRRIGGIERTLLQEITEVSPPTRWSARSVEGPIRASATITIEPLDGGSEVSEEFEHALHIPDPRHILEFTRPVGEQRGGKDG